MKSAMKPPFPSTPEITKQHVLYTRAKIKKLSPSYKTHQSFKDFERLVNSSKLIMGMEKTKISDDDVYGIAKDFLDEALNKSDDDLFSLVEFMNLFQKNNQSF